MSLRINTAKLPRWYVTMTWDDWPEGGSFGCTVRAQDHNEAERMAKHLMAESRLNERDEDVTEQSVFDVIAGNDWYIIDCFDLDAFIERHQNNQDVDADPEFTARVSVRPQVPVDQLHELDRQELSWLDGEYDYAFSVQDLSDHIDDADLLALTNRNEQARYLIEQAALDRFHDSVAIKVLDNFEICVKEPSPRSVEALESRLMP